MKQRDPKATFLLYFAIFVTLWFLFRPRPEESGAEAPTRPADVAVESSGAPSAPDVESTGADGEGDPASVYEIVMAVSRPPAAADGRATPDERGYEATFTTRGAGMSRYRLLGYYRKAGLREPGDETILLDEMLDGRASLSLESVSVATPGVEGSRRTKAVRQLVYHLAAVPEHAVVRQAGFEVTTLPAGVERGGTVLRMRARIPGFDLDVVREYDFAPPPAAPGARAGAPVRAPRPAPRGARPSAAADATGFAFAARTTFVNRADRPVALRYWLAGPAGALPDDRTRTGFQSFLVASLGADGRAVSTELTRIDSLKANEARADKRQRLTWIGLKNRFFATILAADGDGATIPNGIAEMRRPTVRRDGLDLPADVKELIARTQRKPDDGLADAPEVLFNVWADDQPIHPNEARVHGYRFYGGPAETKRLEAADARFQGVVVYTWGWLDPLARIIVTLLGWIHAVVANYGVAMILLTLLIKTLMHPLTRRMYLSSQKMQLVQPLVKEIRRKYANDQQRASQEMMKLYKEHQINPAGGCLPLLVQMPIFFALYGAFSQSFSLRQASFIPKWITDLSVPDSVFTFAKDIPLLSSPEISLLPALYLALQFYQMSLQPKSADPQVQQQQKIMKFMPLVFVFIFYAMPSGLVLYFAASSLYSVIESLHIRRKFPPIVPGTAGAGVEDGQPVATAGVRGHAGIGIGPHQARGGKKRKKR